MSISDSIWLDKNHWFFNNNSYIYHNMNPFPLTSQALWDKLDLGISHWEGLSIHDKLRIVKEARPFIELIFYKLRECYDSPNALGIDSAWSLMYERQDTDTLYFRCWAQMKIEVPKASLQSFLEWWNRWIDQLVDNWNIVFNGNDIPSPLWKNNPYLEVGDIIRWVPPKAQEILHTPMPGTLKRWLRSIEIRLLPPRVSPGISEEQTSQWVSKLRQIGLVKYPTLSLKKRGG